SPRSVLFPYTTLFRSDRPMAEYFAAGRKRLTAVQAGNDYTLLLEYEGGEKRLYDCKPFLQPDTVFAPLREPSVFRRVYLDENHRSEEHTSELQSRFDL